VLLDVVQQLPSARLVSLSGGEPLLRPDLLDLLAGIGRERMVSLETNGGRLDADLAAALVGLGSDRLGSPGLVGVDVSLHGRPRTHDRLVGRRGAFARSLAGLEHLVEARRRAGRRTPLLSVKCVIDAANLDDLGWLRDRVAALGLDHLALKLQDPGRTAMALQASPTAGDDRTGKSGGTGRSPLRRTAPLAWSPADGPRLRAALDEVLAGRAGGPEVFFIPLTTGRDDVLRHYQGAGRLAAADCLNAWSRLSLLPSGEYYLCKIFGAGSVVERAPLEAWNSAPFRAFRRRLLADGLPPGCAGCCYLEGAEPVGS